MLKDLKITKKFPLVMIFFALLSAIATGAIAFVNSKDTMVSSVEDKLISLLESRKSSLQQYFDTIEDDVAFHARSPFVAQALQEFSGAWQDLEVDKEQYLQGLYFYQNPFSTGNKSALLNPGDGSQYSSVHNKYHPVFSNMIEARSFYDLFLFDPEGNLIYSVNKESDFATNFVTGPWKDSQLGKAFNAINKQPDANSMYHADFLAYAPSANQPSSFVGIAVFSAIHEYLGVLAFQLPIEPLNDVMQVTAGMGESGETYLVGRDFLMRSESRFLKHQGILKTIVDTFSVREGLAGNSGIGVIHDYRDISVFSAYTAIDFLDTRWAMIVEVDEAEVLSPLYTMSNFLLFSGTLIAVVIFLFGYLLAMDTALPIVAMTRIMHKLSNNDLDVNIGVSERKDEVGEMAHALMLFKKSAQEQDALKTELIYTTEHDMLTGLKTRKFALEQLELLIKNTECSNNKLVLMFIDLDNFKLINDNFGHHIGDKVLCEVADGLKQCVREEDIIARLGGDEFLIIMPNVFEKNDCTKIVDKIIQSVRSSFSESNDMSKLTLSIGLSIYPDDATTSTALLKKADSAMYVVKNEGKDSYSYWDEELLERDSGS